MKTTKYFDFRRNFPDRKEITDEMIMLAIESPIKTVKQEDARVRIWGRVEERYLRVILLEDGETVHNAFFDRDFSGSETS